jgi:hypothetical protein
MTWEPLRFLRRDIPYAKDRHMLPPPSHQISLCFIPICRSGASTNMSHNKPHLVKRRRSGRALDRSYVTLLSGES